MAISLRNSGDWATSTSTSMTVTLPAHQEGDMLLVRAIRKPYTSPTNMVINTSGWATSGTQYANGTTSNGVGVGSMAVCTFWKIAASSSETDPVITWGATAAPGAAVALSYQKDASEGWLNPTGVGGINSTAATTVNDTLTTHISVTSGDMVDVWCGWADDSGTPASVSISQPGVTYTVTSDIPATALDTSTSNDMAADGAYASASGTSTGAATITASFGSSEEHVVWMTRLRVATPTTYSSSVTADSTFKRIWGTGEATSVRAIGTEASGTTDALTVSIPGTAQTGDYLVMWQVWDNTTANSSVTPSGWTQHGYRSVNEVGVAVYYKQWHNGSDTQVIASLTSSAIQKAVVVAFSDGIESTLVHGSYAAAEGSGTSAVVPEYNAAFSYYHNVVATSTVAWNNTDGITDDQTTLFNSSTTFPRFRIVLGAVVQAASLTAVPGYTATLSTSGNYTYFRSFINNPVAPGLIFADATIKATLSGSITADAEIGEIVGFPAPTWVSPSDGSSLGTNPVLVFTIPDGGTGNYHFHLQLDTANTFNTGSLRELKTNESTTGWEYYNGSTWAAFPADGVSSTYAGNNARYTVQTALATGNWYRRIRGGM